MDPFTVIDKMQIFCKLIEHQHTGSPKEFAKKLGISRSSLYDLIDNARSRGLNIKYSRSIQSFYFKEAIDIDIRFSLNKVTLYETINVDGGSVHIEQYNLLFN